MIAKGEARSWRQRLRRFFVKLIQALMSGRQSQRIERVAAEGQRLGEQNLLLLGLVQHIDGCEACRQGCWCWRGRLIRGRAFKNVSAHQLRIASTENLVATIAADERKTVEEMEAQFRQNEDRGDR